MKFPWIRLLPLVFLVFLAGCASIRTRPVGSRILQQTSEDGGQILLGNGSVVVNNVWNKNAALGPHEQFVFESEKEGGQAFGWQWSWPAGFVVVAYPEVVYGDSPWSEPLGLTDQMPFRVGSRSMTADFDIAIDVNGVCNMAFSFWAVSALPAIKDRVTHEIMIWNFNNGLQPAGARQDTVMLGGATYDVWVLKAHRDVSGQNANTWDYIAFVARKPILKGPLNLSAFFDYLLGKGLITNNHYVTCIELGNEIVRGAGTVEIHGQSITIK